MTTLTPGQTEPASFSAEPPGTSASGCLSSCQPLRREYLQGATYKAIAEKYQIDQRTAKRYVQLNLPLKEYEHRPYHSVLAPYSGLIRKWLLDDQLSSAQIHRRLLEKGCQCSYSLVNRAVQKILRSSGSNFSCPACVKDSNLQPQALYPNLQEKHGPVSSVAAKRTPATPISEKIKEEKHYAQHPHN